MTWIQPKVCVIRATQVAWGAPHVSRYTRWMLGCSRQPRTGACRRLGKVLPGADSCLFCLINDLIRGTILLNTSFGTWFLAKRFHRRMCRKKRVYTYNKFYYFYSLTDTLGTTFMVISFWHGKNLFEHKNVAQFIFKTEC